MQNNYRIHKSKNKSIISVYQSVISENNLFSWFNKQRSRFNSPLPRITKKIVLYLNITYHSIDITINIAVYLKEEVHFSPILAHIVYEKLF